MSTLTLRLEAYARDAKQAISHAQALADERRHVEVEPLHLLYRLVEREDIAQNAIRGASIDPVDVLFEAENELRRVRASAGAPSYLSPRLLDLLGRAEGEGARDGGVPVAVRHLLIACAQEPSGPAQRALRSCGLSAPILRAMLQDDVAEQVGVRPVEVRDAAQALQPMGDLLEQLGRDLTRLAAQGRLDPVVGRDAELRRILQVLARTRENNPLLVGEHGVGRSALVQALALRIARGDVPTLLAGRRIITLETGALLAGAKVRSELEERMRGFLAAIRDRSGEVILFVPELARLFGERAQGAAGELLLSALSRKELRAIAVCTPDELSRLAENNSAVVRRFVTIAIEPPTLDQAIAMMRGLVARFEIEHGVRVTDPALVSAVQLARRYLPSVQLPKSAVDLIDEAAARVRVQMESAPAELDALVRRLEAVGLERTSLEDEKDTESLRSGERLAKEAEALGPRIERMRERWQAELARAREVRRLKEELEAARTEHEQAQAANDMKRANELRFGALPMLEKDLADAQAAQGDETEMLRDSVRAEDVADVVAAWTGVPVAKMLEQEAEKLLHMEERLHERVVGQDEAVRAVSRAIRRGRVGLRDPKKPIGSFLFLGPTGVGKTELAKAVAEFLFDDEAALTRLDMSEFMEKHMVARLLGAPPGYVDSDEGGFLTEAVRRRPYSVVLFDEMEKAHPDVFNILLQVLDDGRLTDSRGRVAYFADTVIIMTSNVGSHAILDHEGTPEELREILEAQMRTHFRPEFLNRIDDVVIFDPLTKNELRGIVDIQLRRLAELLESRDVRLEPTDAAKDLIVELGHEPAFGARPLKRVILKRLQDPLAEELLRGGYKAGDSVRIDAHDGQFAFTRAS